MKSLCPCFLFLVTLVLVSGCTQGPELGDVTGTISMDGEPVENAYVTFLPMFPEGMELVGKTDSQGVFNVKYSADRNGVPPGKYQILLSTLDDIKEESGRNRKVPERFPKVYVNNDSPLTFEVKPGPNDVSFDVSSKPPKE